MFSHLNPLPSLPKYTGHYKVGTTEFEIPISEIPSQSAIPDSRISTIKFRVFYPTNSDSRSKQSVYWLPSPQTRWTKAYASFMGASSRLSSVISSLPSILNWVTIPAVKDAPLLNRQSAQWPVCIFSHGLGGNYNTYSSIVGSLASCGVVCVAPEHRDGSSPISFIRNADGKNTTTIDYRKISHSPSPEVLNARNEQLRIRLWEFELTYAAISAMNQGKIFTNHAENVQHQPSLGNQLNLEPGKVFWAGHSFGAATVTQFVKSIFYHQQLPKTPRGSEGEWNWTPLYRTTSGSELVMQITAESPVALLDLWTMPLRSETTKWLWERPMPCYTRRPSAGQGVYPNTVAIMSAEFHKWTDLRNRTRALLSQSPIEAAKILEKEVAATQAKEAAANEEESVQNASRTPSHPIPELAKHDPPLLSSSSEPSRTPSPAASVLSVNSGVDSPTSSTSSLPPPDSIQENPSLKQADHEASHAPHLYLVSQSAHLSQSDFGPLFPSLVKYAMKAIDPEKTVELNVRAMASLLRGCGLPVENLSSGDDYILGGDGEAKEPRWIRLPLVET